MNPLEYAELSPLWAEIDEVKLKGCLRMTFMLRSPLVLSEKLIGPSVVADSCDTERVA